MSNKDTSTNNGLTRDTIYTSQSGSEAAVASQKSGNSMYNVFNATNETKMSGRSFKDSRLWHGVPELTQDQMRMFEAAYTGHTFFFVTDLPKFMTTGIFKDTTNNVHQHALNLKAIIEKCCMSFSGPASITVNTSDQDDGAGRKISHITQVTKEQNDISLKLHEFAGLPVKNALETWVTGTYDYRSQHGNYLGNLNIDGGWCLANHTMGLLVVQVDPSWTEIQDAAWYCNMFPMEVPFDSFANYDKGTSDIVPDMDLQFKCNEVRSAQVMKAAEVYMNNRILNLVNTAVYDSREFKPFDDLNNVTESGEHASWTESK